VHVRGLLARLPWSIVAFAFALFVVVFALGKAGAAEALAAILDSRGRDTIEALVIGGVVVALLSASVNNLPVLLVTILSLQALGATHALPYAALVGANVGSKLTPLGSLATLLWLDMLKRRDLHVGWGEYTRAAWLPSLAALLAAVLALALAG
jgi:arsenical pump membrane protein